jgi:hypothetical protein
MAPTYQRRRFFVPAMFALVGRAIGLSAKALDFGDLVIKVFGRS